MSSIFSFNRNIFFKDRIAELENELRVSRAQNDMLRRRFLLEEVVDSLSSNSSAQPGLIEPAPTNRLIASSNPKATMTLTSRRQQGLENRRNPTTRQFVAALEEAEEEERKDVALLLNNNNTSMATTTSSNTLTRNVEVCRHFLEIAHKFSGG